MSLLKKQRDAVGLSLYSDSYEYYAPEKGSDRHHRMLIDQLEKILETSKETKKTNTVDFLNQIAEKIHRRSMVVLFTDMFQNENEEAIFKALQHLKHNKHKVIVFHVYDEKSELKLDYDGVPRKFIDVETGETVNLFTENTKDVYEKAVELYFKKIKIIYHQFSNSNQ